MIFPEHAQELAAVLADHLATGPHAPVPDPTPAGVTRKEPMPTPMSA
jgi:hypothetical protein